MNSDQAPRPDVSEALGTLRWALGLVELDLGGGEVGGLQGALKGEYGPALNAALKAAISVIQDPKFGPHFGAAWRAVYGSEEETPSR